MSLMVISFKGSDDGPDGPFVVCNRACWTGVLDWITTLPSSFTGLKALMASGSTKDTAQLGTEIALAVQNHAPPPMVALAMKNMLQYMVNGEQQETAIMEEE